MTAAAGVSGMFDERIDPGRVTSIVLAAAMHLALFAVLVFGVSWQNRPPEAIQVELWNEPEPVPVQAQPKPVPEVAKPLPEPVVAKPEPVIAKPEPVIAKPEIAIKEPLKTKPVAKLVPKPEPKLTPKAEPSKPKVDETLKRNQEVMAQEERARAVERELQQLNSKQAAEATNSQKRDYEVYAGRIKAKIRGNIRLPLDIKGNPEAIFDVVQLPNGEVLSVKLRKSSGHAGYDESVERAVWKSSPLPKPDRPELFQRALELKFRPLD